MLYFKLLTKYWLESRSHIGFIKCLPQGHNTYVFDFLLSQIKDKTQIFFLETKFCCKECKLEQFLVNFSKEGN
jgi:hypothetical protein